MTVELQTVEGKIWNDCDWKKQHIVRDLSVGTISKLCCDARFVNVHTQN